MKLYILIMRNIFRNFLIIKQLIIKTRMTSSISSEEKYLKPFSRISNKTLKVRLILNAKEFVLKKFL